MLKAEEKQEQASAAFAALGDSTRLQLLTRLGSDSNNSISELSSGLQLSRQGVTKHLRVLEDAGIVVSHRVGRETQFTLVPESLAQLQTYLESVSSQWDDAIDRLQAFVEKE